MTVIFESCYKCEERFGPYTCSKCDKDFIVIPNKQAGPNYKPFACSKCDQDLIVTPNEQAGPINEEK